MAGEKARHIMKRAQDSTAEAMREWEENGALRHLHGKRLDLSDDSPDWFVHKLLKREGIAPPLVEQGKDIDAATRQAETILERLRRRRDWLAQPQAGCTAETAQAFNETRARTLEEYGQALTALNRAILNYNLVAPLPMHRRGIIVARAMEDAERAVPPLDVAAFAPAPVPQTPGSSRSRLPWRRRRAGD